MDEQGYDTLTVRFESGVAVVSLDRPPVNAINRQMQTDLRVCFEALSQDRSIGAVVLAAQGAGPFCAGIDLREVATGRPAPDRVEAVIDAGWEWRQTQRAVRHCAVPVIAAVEGATIGAGFGLVGVCDLIIASSSAKFALTEINVGLLGGASKALKLLGPAKARRMMFTGEFVTAAEMFRLGGIEELVQPGEALAAAIALGAVMAGKSPLALRLAKESILRIEGNNMEDQYRTEQDYTARLMRTTDSAEAMQAFVQKRPPVWTWS